MDTQRSSLKWVGMNDVLIGDIAGGRNTFRDRHFEHQLRRVECSSLWSNGTGGGASRGSPSGACAPAQAQSRRDLFRRQSWIVREAAATWIRKPGRHGFFSDRIANSGSQGSRLAISFERHGRHFTCAMAGLAALLENGKNVSIESWERLAEDERKRGAERTATSQDLFFGCHRTLAACWASAAPASP